MSGPEPSEQLVVTNEFGTVVVTVAQALGATELALFDVTTGATTRLSAVELEALARSTLAERIELYRLVMRMSSPGERDVRGDGPQRSNGSPGHQTDLD